jgi:hypothetical protein
MLTIKPLLMAGREYPRADLDSFLVPQRSAGQGGKKLVHTLNSTFGEKQSSTF